MQYSYRIFSVYNCTLLCLRYITGIYPPSQVQLCYNGIHMVLGSRTVPMFFPHQVLSGGSVLTPTRTPLQPVNRTPGCATPLLLKRAQYSQVTPFGTPPVRTPRREKRLAPSALCLLSNSKSPSTRDVQLNSLVYKKVLEIISKKETVSAIICKLICVCTWKIYYVAHKFSTDLWNLEF